MCGIIGYIGRRRVCPLLLTGLKHLEYRGYDSAGLALMGDNDLTIIRSVGRIAALEAEAVKSPTAITATAGIGHTRWATHGEILAENAHPHTSLHGDLAIVHNGIIENNNELRQKYRFVCTSQTDSEVLAHLIGYYYSGDVTDAVKRALDEVHGSYGLVVMHKDHPGQMVVARLGSPIVVGEGDELTEGTKEYFVASDATPLLHHTRTMLYLNDGEIATINPEGITVIPHEQPLTARFEKIDWDVAVAEKGGYDTFMLKEIYEQPSVLIDAIRGRYSFETGDAHLGGINLSDEELRGISRVVIIACGTAAYSGMLAKWAFEELAGIPTDVELAGEFRYRNPIIDRDTLVLAISQSGETADTLAAVREAKQKNAIVRGIINVIGSTIPRETGGGTYIHAGPEFSVASTKAFTNSYIVMLLYALKLGRLRGLAQEDGRDLIRALLELPGEMEKVLKQAAKITDIAESFKDYQNFFYIARGLDYPVALEGSLKLKEVTYIHSEAYPAAEIKHGPIALLSPEFPVVAILSEGPLYDKMRSNLEEVKARKAPILALVPEGDQKIKAITEYIIEVPKASRLVYPVLCTMVLQLFAHDIAQALGRDVDRPRNLAKSVTVE
jgi:glucosamine--fructose-6-phosphate aminotransferase (isomerizing)